MAKIRYKEVLKSIASSPTAAKRMQTIYQNKFAVYKEEFLQEFDADEITQELSGGSPETNSNISNTLGGYGNLFSFCGFPQGTDVIGPLRSVLVNQLLLIRSRKPTVENNKITFRFSLKIPTKAIKEATLLPWEQGVSWAFAVERGGISGFGHYIYNRLGIGNSSRSTTGLQLSNTNLQGEGSFKTRKYLSKFINNLAAKFGSNYQYNK